MGSRPERGAYGNARGKPDKQVRARKVREASPRHQAAKEEVRRSREEIERLQQQALTDAEEHRGRPTLNYVKPQEEKVEVPALGPLGRLNEDPGEPRPAPRPDQGRFVDCHCGHQKFQHGSAGCGHERCECTLYRPKTSPDPFLFIPTPTETMDTLVALVKRGLESENRRVRTLATKVGALSQELVELLNAEDEEREAREAEERRTREAREKIERLERELEEARAAIGIKPKKKREPKVKPEKAAGKFQCPDCQDSFDTPQGRGAHRYQKHGHRAVKK